MCVSTFDQNSDVSLWRSGHGECGRYIGLITVQLLEEKKTAAEFRHQATAGQWTQRFHTVSGIVDDYAYT